MAGRNRVVSSSVCAKASALVIVAMSFIVGPASAELKWTGRYSNVWDLSALNFENENGEEVAFTAGSDVRFDDTAQEKTVFFAMNKKAMGTLIVSNSVDYVFTNIVKTGYLDSISRLRKQGSGKLAFTGGAYVALIHDYGEGLFVDEGEVKLYGYGMLGYYNDKPNGVLYAGTNATLRLSSRAIFSAGNSPVLTPIRIAGGHLVIEENPNINAFEQMGPVTLDNATVDYSGFEGYSAYLGVLQLSGGWTFRGNTPYDILVEGFSTSYPKYNAHKKFNLYSNPKTEFCVEEITDEREDVVIGVPLVDQVVQNKDPLILAPGGLVKTGAGTLALTNAANRFCGDVEVREGMLQLGPNINMNASSLGTDLSCHWIGNLLSNRQIVVKSGALLYLPSRATFGSMAPVTNIPMMKAELVFDGGAITNYEDGNMFLLLPDVTFSNGGKVAPGRGKSGYGRFMVQDKFKVTGSVPFEWWPRADRTTTASAWSDQALALNGYPENTFEIDDVTGDSAVDATFGVPFIIASSFFRGDIKGGGHSVDEWSFGFVKTGAGTMRLAAPKIKTTGQTSPVSGTIYYPSGTACQTFNGDAKVNEGTLQVDGDISYSDTVRVAAGAYLSGTGKVNNVAIAAGGGLRVGHRQTVPLRIGGDLSVGEGLVVDVDLPIGANVSSVRSDMLVVTGDVTGAENFASATVRVDGVAVPNLKLEYESNLLRVHYMRGVRIILR
ncbi:MAG: autotransporter-associated beta strand repeat-containing protein [Kiritimatiellae bacterium]|nr:autotransporter-associated beta strand repeat-containing protein [Kiritimatiellia bacterium]